MQTPIVTALPRLLEPVTWDPFIDDVPLRAAAPSRRPTGGVLLASTQARTRPRAPRVRVCHPARVAPVAVTVLFTDIEGSTALLERVGEWRWLALLERHGALVRELVSTHGGLVVKSLGDGFMVAFGDARAAVRCAMAIQRHLAGAAARGFEEALRVRIGAHTGTAVHHAGDLYGRTVNVAARITEHAGGGETIISQAVARAGRLDQEARLVARPKVALRGTPGHHVLYAVDCTPLVAMPPGCR